ncbi:MAG: LamG domain-containing protein [Verrucomicrobiota bacterium]|jgi:hypothetical protein
MKKLLTIANLLAALSPSFGLGIVDFENFSNSLIYTNAVHNGPATGLISGAAGAYYFALLSGLTNATTIDATLDNGTPLASGGWVYEDLGTNTATPGLMNGNYTTDPGVGVSQSSGDPANFVVVGWSANIGTTFSQAKIWWNNGCPTAGPSGYFGISGIAQDIIVGGNPYPVPTIFGPTPRYEIQGFTLNWYALPPQVATLPATGSPATAVTLNGTVSPNGVGGSAWFQWGTTAAYGNTTPRVGIGSGMTPVPVSATLAGLNPSLGYHYRAVGSNSMGVTYGSDCTFNSTLQSSRGYALSFDGATGYVRIPGFFTNIPNTAITVEFWQKVNAVANQSTFCESTFVNGSVLNAHVPYGDGKVYWDFGNISTGGRLSYTPPVSIVGTWQHFALVVDGVTGEQEIYRNGVREAAAFGTPQLARTNLDLVLGGATAGVPYGGLIDEFRIWNVPRYVNDIQANMYRHLTGSEPGLFAYWTFNEGSGATTYDATGRGANTGFLSNGVTWVVSDIPLSPDVATMPATGMGATNATLNGTVIPNGLATTAWFQWGTTTAYGNTTAVANMGSGTSATTNTVVLIGLVPGSTYHYCAVAGSSLGTNYGADVAFIPSPALSIVRSGTNALVSWITNASGFSLWYATNLPPASWTSNSSPPAIVSGQYTVTNPISGGAKFYRLRK